jgi:iron complex outermembrane recepter protein
MQGNSMTRRLSKSALVGSTAILAGMALAGSAYAADAPADQAKAQSTQEVVVTGSRIARRDFTSNSPIVTVNSAAFQNTANVAVEATLNKLPQFTPAQDLTGVNSEDVQPTATNTVGISTASLRGLGSNRNLVLADGQRLQPVNGALVVDLNSIPSAIIDHVEVITGGASAVYGADAVSGVVNFILKKNYQGMDVDAQWGTTQAGDGQEFKVSAIMGTNFADDRGNVTFALERYTRGASWEKNHSFYTNGWADPTMPNNEFFNTGTFYFGPGSPPSPFAVAALFGTPLNFGSPYSFFQVNNNGTMAAGTFGNPGTFPGPTHYTGAIDGKHVAYENFVSPSGAIVKGIKTNQVDDYFVTSPINRWSLYASSHYDITDNLTAYMRGTFASTHTATNLFPTPFIGGWSTVMPYDAATDGAGAVTYSLNPANPSGPPIATPSPHPVPAQLATLLNSRANPNAPWPAWIIPNSNDGGWMPPRSTVDDNQVWQFTAGLKGTLPIKDWTWELYGSHGQASDYTQGNGYASLQRFIDVLTSPNWGAGQTFIGNQANGGFGVAHAHCTSGFYGALFLGEKPSQDCIDAITSTLQSRVLEEQNIVEFDTQGTLFHAPAGDVKLSLGADFRDEYVKYTPDILQSTSSFIDQVAGVYPTSYEDSSTSAREGYGELLVPVLADLPFVKHFDLELGARYSTYTGDNHLTGEKITPPGGWTYKILGDWKITDWARVRGGYNLSVRSPNVGELFLAKQEVYAAGGATAYGDPCTLRSLAPFGAGGAELDPVTNAAYAVKNAGGLAGATSAFNICKALMGGTGANYFYGGGGTAQVAGAPSVFSFVNQLGNQNLKAEKGHTWTAGIVLNSPIHNPWVDNLRASIDWYNIKVNGAIEFQSVDQVKAACYGQSAPDAATAAVVAASAPCQLVARIPGTGQEDTTTIQFQNQATIWTKGIDFQLDDGWNFDSLGLKQIPGRLQFNWLFTYLQNYDTQAFPGGPIYHWAGTLGPSLNGVNPGSAYKYKMNTTLTYMEGPLTASLSWRYLPHVHNANYPLYTSQPGGLANCNVTLSCSLDTAAYHVFDLALTYAVKQNYVLRFGIDNLFDKSAPTTGATSGIGLQSGGTYAAGGTLAQDGAGMTNASLYDTLGRRFYVGLNAKF